MLLRVTNAYSQHHVKSFLASVQAAFQNDFLRNKHQTLDDLQQDGEHIASRSACRGDGVQNGI